MTAVTPQVVTASIVSAGQVSAFMSGTAGAPVGDPGDIRATVFLADVTVTSSAVVDVDATATVTIDAVTVTSEAEVTTPTTGLVTITMPTSVDETTPAEVGTLFQGVGPHTLYGAAVYFDENEYIWTSVNGVGVDPSVTGTGYEVALTGTAPFSAASWATAAETVIEGEGYTVSRTDGVLEVTVASPSRATAAAAAQAALTDFAGRGDARVVGATQQSAGTSQASNTTGWVQVLPADVPSGAFRVIGFSIRRGNNIGSGVRMAVASRPGGNNGNPQGAVVGHQRTMGDSGATQWHTEYLAPAEVVYYSGGESIYIGIHGDGANSSVFGGSAVDDGLFASGSTNLWLTDGTSGDTTPIVSPAGAVTSSFNFGVSVRIIIQEAPYQADGGYRVIAGAIEGRHDGTLTQTNMDEIFVAWRFDSPDLDDVRMYPPRIRLQAHDAGASNQLRLELWNPLGGSSTFVGDTLVGLLALTSDTQGTGWSTIGDPDTPVFSLSAATEYRFSIKGAPAPGESSDTQLSVWLGTAGAGAQTLAGHEAYGPNGEAWNLSEREVLANYPGVGTDETALDFDPSVATASPNNANGTVDSPNNTPMISIVFGKPAPIVAAG